jgi:hypothetical protein
VWTFRVSNVDKDVEGTDSIIAFRKNQKFKAMMTVNAQRSIKFLVYGRIAGLILAEPNRF